MKVKSLAALLVACGCLNSGCAQDWQSLFDGKTLNGWKPSESQTSFKVADGCIVGAGQRSHLFYVGPEGQADFTNFEFSAEVLTRDAANSGVFFHTEFSDAPSPPGGFEAQVFNAPGRDGIHGEKRLTGSLYGLRDIYKPMVPDGEWFTLRITVRGARVQIHVNQTLLVDYVEPSPPPEVPRRPGRKLGHGTFALQCHGPAGSVSFRNLRVRVLPAEPDQSRPALTPGDQELVRLAAAGIPLINYHVHLKGGLTLEEALALSRRTGVFYGLAVNCGLNFSVTNDAGIYNYLKEMKGQPVFAAMQAEGREWVNLFSRQAISQFDYVFTDSMTIFDNSGRRMRLWLPNEVPPISDPQAFMDMLVDRTVKILETEPINVYVNPTFLPAQIAADYDQLWTEARMRKVVEAAAQHHIAIEINSRYRLPGLAFLKLAKAAGCQFTFGTNNGDRDVGRLDYSFQMVRELGLKSDDIWLPTPRPLNR